MAKERVDVLAYKQGLFETREQAMLSLMVSVLINQEKKFLMILN